jgi:hypothetical protein
MCRVVQTTGGSLENNLVIHNTTQGQGEHSSQDQWTRQEMELLEFGGTPEDDSDARGSQATLIINSPSQSIF